MVDGYTTSDAYPFSREIPAYDGINYMRNAVKATVDAYDGETHIYVFDPADPVIGAYRALFPALFEDASKMPSGLRAHTRYPEELFRVQADVYRVYHMRNPQAFCYNNEDIWGIGKILGRSGSRAPGCDPLLCLCDLARRVATGISLDDNLYSRDEGKPHWGNAGAVRRRQTRTDYGDAALQAGIDSGADAGRSADQSGRDYFERSLTLWNQQGSQVLQGQTLVLPIGDTFLYISPFYLQATQARMPQLKKVVLAMGNRLIYADSYEQALAEINGIPGVAPPPQGRERRRPSSPALAANVRCAHACLRRNQPADPRMESLRKHMERYRETRQPRKVERRRTARLDAIQSGTSR